MQTYNRDDWEFTFQVSKVLEGARSQLDYRQGRVKFWLGKKDEVMKEIGSSGLSIYEPEAEKFSSYTNSTRGHHGAQVQVDPNLQKRLTEATEKSRENIERVAEYEAWVQFLTAGKPEDTLKLKHEDWMFFFGKR